MQFSITMRDARGWTLLVLVLVLCGNVSVQPLAEDITLSGYVFDECLVPCNDILQLLEKDKIPSIDTPVYTTVDNTDISSDSARIMGLVVNGTPIAYPYEILDFHEIVNEVTFGDFRVSYCPLTATGLAFNASEFDNSFIGTSGALYENNLVLYDRDSDNYWSQMMSTSIMGDKMGDKVEILATYEMSWGAWKALYPDTQVLSRQTGYDMEYDLHPYAGYETDDEIHFRSSFDSLRYPYMNYHAKETVLYLSIHEQSYIFPFSELEMVGFVELNIGGTNFVVLFDAINRIAEVYEADVNGKTLNFDEIRFQEINSKNFTVFVDTEMRDWNILGQEINSNSLPKSLTHIATYNAYWFGATAFFNSSLVYSAEKGFQTWEQLIPEISSLTRPVFTYNNTSVLEDNEANAINFSIVIFSAFIITIYRYYGKKSKKLE